MKKTKELKQEIAVFSEETTIAQDLSTLPDLVLLRLFSFLSTRDVVRTTQTCWTLRAWADLTPIRQRIAPYAIGFLVEYLSKPIIYLLGSNGECILVQKEMLGMQFWQIAVPKSFHRITSIERFRQGFENTLFFLGKDSESSHYIGIGLSNRKGTDGDSPDSRYKFEMYKVPEVFGCVTEFINHEFLCGRDKSGRPQIAWILYSAKNPSLKFKDVTHQLPPTFARTTQTTQILPAFNTALHKLEDEENFICGRDMEDKPTIIKITKIFNDSSDKYKIVDIQQSELCPITVPQRSRFIGGISHLTSECYIDDEVEFRPLTLPRDFIDITHLISIGRYVDDKDKYDFVAPQRARISERPPLFVLFGANKDQQSILARCNGVDDLETQFIPLPMDFANNPRFTGCLTGCFLHGVDARGTPLLFSLRWQPPYPDETAFSLGTEDTKCMSFTPVKLPETFANITRVIPFHTEDFKIFFVHGTDINGRPLLAGCGDNFCGCLGTGDTDSRNALELIVLPENFAEITQIVSEGTYTIVHGIDAYGYPLIAHAGAINYQSNSEFFSLITLPECMATQFTCLLAPDAVAAASKGRRL
jgi:hypothetical protein